MFGWFLCASMFIRFLKMCWDFALSSCKMPASCQKSILMIILLSAEIFWIIPTGNAFPSRRKQPTDDSKLTIFSEDVHNYLMEFGYLPKSDIETGNLRTEDQLKEAIKNLQRFGNIPETGVIDDKTRMLIRKPRCGVPDRSEAPDFSSDNRGGGRRRHKRFVIQGSKWQYTNLTWSLVNQTMSGLDAGQVRRVLTEALDVWSKNSRLTFSEIYSEDADIQVLFARRYHGDGYDFDGPGQVLAHAFYPGHGRGGDAHFDEEENWFLNGTHSNEGTNLLGVAVHEFGHSLGLGHSSVEDAIMFPWYHGYQISGSLPEDDRLAIQQIYGAKEKQWGPYLPGGRPHTTTTRKPDMRFYPDRRNPNDRDDPRRYPDRQHPNEAPNWDQNDPRHPDYDPRSDPRHPHYDPRSDPKHPQYDSRSDPRDPEYNPRSDPRHPEYNPLSDPKHPYYDTRSDPKHPHYDTRTDPRYNRRHHHGHEPSEPRNEPSEPRNEPRYPGRYPETEPPRDNPRYPETNPPPPRHHPTKPNRIPFSNPRYPHTHYPPKHPNENPRSTPHHYPPTRKYHYPVHRTTERPKKDKPDTCNTDYDAISMILGEMFIFKDEYLWRIGKHGPYAGYPHEIRRIWRQLPENFTRIDAVYENKDGKIVFFIGRQYYVFKSNNLLPGYPKPLTELGLPSTLNKIDAALIWSYNNRTYFYSGTLYWRFDEEVGKVELDYPRDMSIWQGIGYHIDTAFQYINGKTYFFKGRGYWEFNDSLMKVYQDRPRASASEWMRCPRTSNEIDDLPPRRKEPLTSDVIFTSSASSRRKLSDNFRINQLLGLLVAVIMLLSSSYVH